MEKHTVLTLLGATNIGKTRTLGLTCPQPILIECDKGGDDSIPELPQERIFQVWKEENPIEAIENIIKRILDKENPLPCETIIWDGMGEFSNNAIDWIMDNVTLYRREGDIQAGRIIPEREDYQGLANRIRRIMRKMAQIKAHEIHTAHIKIDPESKRQSPNILGSVRSTIIESQSSFSAVMRKGVKSVEWNFSMGHELLTKSRFTIQKNEQNQKTTRPNFAAFFRAVLVAAKWSEAQINEEMARQYGSPEEYNRILALKYADMIQ